MTPDRAPLTFAAILALSVALPLTTLARESSGPAPSLRDCIDNDRGSSWAPYDDHTILVRSGARSYRLTTNTCPSLSDPAARLSTEVVGGNLICSPHDVHLKVARSGEPIAVPCFVQSITPLSKDEARALQHRSR